MAGSVVKCLYRRPQYERARRTGCGSAPTRRTREAPVCRNVKTRRGPIMLDWDDLRFFLAIARHGSLSAAAKDLHVAQSTVGRRLASLEASLGVRLLNRTPEGYVPTPAGHDVREQAERLEAEALSVERNVGGLDTRLAGLVRVTC